MGINLPEYSKLDKPHKIEGTPAEARRSFYELARSRVRLVSEEEHFQFEKDVFGKDRHRSSAVYIVNKSDRLAEGSMEKFVDALDISVNKNSFYLEGEDYSDLIPYVIEHEIYESYLWSKKGVRPHSREARHLLAKRRQFDLAMQDGKAERLLEFYKKRNNLVGNELDYAYQKALQRHKKTK